MKILEENKSMIEEDGAVEDGQLQKLE